MIRKEVKKVTKYLNFEVAEHKSAGDELIIEGYANTSSKDRVGDVVLPSAFVKTLPVYLKNPVLLENHNLDRVAGRVLEAKVTDKGLYIKARISDTRSDLKTQIKEGCLSIFSIGYNETDSDFDESTKTRVIKELELLEISIVTVPANTEASFSITATKVEAPTCEKCDMVMEKQGDEYKCMKCMKALDSPLAIVSPPAEPPKCEWCEAVMQHDDANGAYVCDCKAAKVKIERSEGESLEACVSRGIAKLINEGYSQDQAAAIAYKMCGEKGVCVDYTKVVDSLKEISDIATKAFGSIDHESLVVLFDLYNKEGNVMKKLDKEKLIEVLKSAIKSDPAVSAAEAADPTKKNDPAMAAAEGATDHSAMMEKVMAKLDAIGQAMAQLLEGSKPAAEPEKAADPAAPAAETTEDEKGLEGLTDKEIQELETDISRQLDELDDNS